MALDLGGAVLGWLVADAGKAGSRAAEKLALGEPQQRALRTAVLAAIHEVVEDLENLRDDERQHLTDVLTGGSGGGETQQWTVRNEADLRSAISSWITSIDTPEFGERYLQKMGIDRDNLSTELADKILDQIDKNARDGRALAPLAEWLWRDETSERLERIETAVQKSSRISTVPISLQPPVSRLEREPKLRGRAKIFRELTKTLLTPELSHRTRVIHGLGGSGKTLVALSVAREALKAQVDVWWVSAADVAQFRASMLALAIELGATADEIRFGSTAEVIWRRLEARSRRWLLIIDNADDPRNAFKLDDYPVSDGRGWIRRTENDQGMTLITTRDGSRDTWGPAKSSWVRLHLVRPLSAHQGGQVLHELTGPSAGTMREAELLSERLGGLPLAIRLVGRYLAESAALPANFAHVNTISTFNAYRESLDSGTQAELFTNPSGADANDGQDRELIGLTWELSLSLLARRGMPQARSLLRLLSTFAGTAMIYDFLLEPRLLTSHSDFFGIDGRKLWRLLHSLANLGLVDLNAESPSNTNLAQPRSKNHLTIHPLVRDATWHQTVLEGKAADYIVLASNLMLSAVETLGNPEMQSSWPEWDGVYAHAFRIWERAKKHGVDHESMMKIVYLVDSSARYLLNKGLYATVEERYRELCDYLISNNGNSDPTTLWMRHRLAHVLEDRGKFEESEAVHRSVIEIHGASFGADDRRTLVLRECLVSALKSQNRLTEAEAECRAVMSAMIEKFGEDSEYALACRHHLAHVLLDQGLDDESRREHANVVAGMIKTKGRRDYNTLAARHCLATVLARTGETQLALDEYRPLLRDQAEVLGNSHHMTLGTLHQFAHLLDDLNMAEQAEAGHRAVLEARIDTLGEKHPQTLASRVCLAVHLRKKGSLESAAEECHVAISSIAGVLEPTHPQVISARWMLIQTLEEMGDPDLRDEAAFLLETLLRMDEPDLYLTSECARILRRDNT